MVGNEPMPMAAIGAALEERLAWEKARLVAALGSCLDDDGERVIGEFGASGRLRSWGFPGAFYVNCNRRGEPCEMVGRGKGRLAHYFWIPVVYREGGRDECYVLALSQDDLDVRTGNVHTCFGRLQFLCTRHEGLEVGGQTNSEPVRVDGGWRLDYQADDAFPRAIIDYGEGCEPRTVVDDDRPWGYAGFERVLPVMDLADPAYDPMAVADFFMRLVAHDLRTALRHSRPEGASAIM